MDRQAWIVISLCVVVLILWNLSRPAPEPRPSAEPGQEETQPGTAPGGEDTAAAGDGEKKADETSADGEREIVVVSQEEDEETTAAERIELPEEVEHVLENKVATFIFTNHGGGLKRAVLKNHFHDGGENIVMNEFAQGAVGHVVQEPGTEELHGYEITDSGDTFVQYERTDQAGIKITKTYTILPSYADDKVENSHRVGLKLEFTNTAETNQRQPEYYINCGEEEAIYPTDSPMYTQLHFFSDRKRKVGISWFDGSRIPLIGIETRAPSPAYEKSVEGLRWASVSNQFFAIVVSPLNATGDGVWATRTPFPEDSTVREYSPKQLKRLQAIHGALKMPGLDLPPSESVSHEFDLYIGPKEHSRLSRAPAEQDKLLEFGLLKPVSVGLLWSLDKLHEVFGNIGLPYTWGLAIVAITILLKIILWPLQTKSMRSMKEMSEKMKVINPRMEELRKKYKDEPQKLNEEMMKLYRQYKINPIGGCLPSLMQLPIFLGFFYMLRTAVELRNSGFLWVDDLSRPDTVAVLLGFLPINPLPILMTAAMVVYMMLQPKTGNEMQQKMMMFMPVIFFFICYNFASALALYWTTQNVLSIVQFYMTKGIRESSPKVEAPEPESKGGEKSARVSSVKTVGDGEPPKKKKGWLEQLQEEVELAKQQRAKGKSSGSKGSSRKPSSSSSSPSSPGQGSSSRGGTGRKGMPKGRGGSSSGRKNSGGSQRGGAGRRR